MLTKRIPRKLVARKRRLFTLPEKCIRHCVCTRKKDTLCLRSSTSYWISPLRSASKKAFAGSYCILPWKFQMALPACDLHLQPDISGMFSRMEDELKFLNIVFETCLISWTIRHDDLSHLSDMFSFFDLERKKILYNYL